MTGIYGANAAGEALPPIYCFDTKAQTEDKFQLKQSWVQGLPKVKGRYGCPTVEEWDSFVSVRKSGCTDEKLMQQIIEEVYLPLYPNIHHTTERDESGKFLRGPIIIKTD
jgi:hypothetical protein